MFRIIVLLLASHLIGVVHAQEDCAAVFRKATDQVRSMRLLAQNKNGFEMQCSIRITPETGAVVNEHLQVVAYKNKYKCITSQYSLYQDASTMVVIQHDQKSVFITHPVSAELRENQFTQMITLQDSLQKHLKLGSCSREFGSILPNEGYIRITFLPDDKIDGLGLKAITYWVELKRYEVKKIMIDYTPNSGYGVKKYELLVDKMNPQSIIEPFKNGAINQSMQKGKLKPEYTGYTLIDKRN